MPDGIQFNAKTYEITYFTDQFAQEKWQHSNTLAELEWNIRSTSEPDKASLPWLKLAIFGDQRTDRNCLRHDANVDRVTGGEGDYDNGALTFDQAVARIRAAKVKALIYTTPSNTDAKPHWRILAPFSAPLEPARRAELMDQINGLAGGGLAPESWVLSQAYYFGSIEGQPSVQVEVIEGDYIDQRPDIVSIPNPNTTKKQAEPSSNGSASSAQGDPIDIAAYLEQIGNDERPWEEWNTILMAIFAASGGSSLGLDLAVEWSAKAAKHVAGEVEKRWKRYHTSPPNRIGAGMLRRMARNEEWIAKVASWDWSTSAMAEPFGTAGGEDTGPFLMTEAEIFAMPDPTVLVEGMLMVGENICLVAPPKSGKTFLALDICLSIAAGLPVLGKLKTYRQGAVVYLTAEGKMGFKRRIKAWRQARQIAPDQKLPFFFKAAVPMTAKGAAEARRYIDGIRSQVDGVVLTAIDTMARSLGTLDENAASSAAAYFELTEEIRSGLDTTMLTLAHATDKTPPGRRGSRKEAEMGIRGSSGFGAGFDSVWTLDMNPENRTVKMAAKYMKEADEADGYGPHCFRLKREHVADMANGSGAVLELVTLAEWYGTGETITDNERPLLKALREIAALGGHENWETGITGNVLAEGMTNAERGYTRDKAPSVSSDAPRLWEDEFAKNMQRVENALRPSCVWSRPFHEDHGVSGRRAHRWFVPRTRQHA